MVSHKDKIKLFKRLADNDKLFHAYLFFGEPQVGKFLFAKCLANYLEKSEFGELKGILEEVLIISPNEKGVIGIDVVKKLTNFLYQKPIFSKKRTAIIRDAENLTPEAQNAILKIVEEAPPSALIILIAQAEDLLLKALISRLQKIYFSRAPQAEITEYLKKIFGKDKKIDAKKIKDASEESFGRPGRAIEIIGGLKFNIKGLKLEDIVENNKIDDFFEFLIIKLRKSGFRDIEAIKEVLKRLSLIKMFNVNKKLQLKTLQKYI